MKYLLAILSIIGFFISYRYMEVDVIKTPPRAQYFILSVVSFLSSGIIAFKLNWSMGKVFTNLIFKIGIVSIGSQIAFILKGIDSPNLLWFGLSNLLFISALLVIASTPKKIKGDDPHN